MLDSSARGESWWSEDRWGRYAPLTGVLAVVLWVISVIAIESGDAPDDDASPAEIAAYFNDEDVRILLGGYLFMLGAMFFIWFLGSVRARLASAEGGAQRIAAVVFGTGVVVAAMIMASQAPSMGGALLVEASDTEVGEGSAQAFAGIGDGFFAAATAALAVFFLAAGVAIMRTRALPSWLGLATLVLGVVALIAPIGWVVLIFGLPIWVLIVTWFLFAGTSGAARDRTTAAAPPPASAV